MNILEYLRIALNNLGHRKMRAWLTMIGIFIGITAVVAILSLGQGLEAAIDEQFETLGTDKIFVSPGGGALSASSTAANLTERDRKIVDRTLGVDSSVGMTYKSAKVEYKDEENFALVMAVTLDDGGDLFADMWGKTLEEGRLLEQGDDSKAYLTYDYTVDKKVFDRRLKLSDSIFINGEKFDIIGFQEKVGNSGDDQTIYLTADAYERVFGENIEDNYMNIIVKVSEGAEPRDVANRIEKDLRKDRGLDVGDEDFTIETAEEFMESFGDILLIVQVVIFGIAAISLFVGGIGIMNTMYTAVVERTQEIGIMKAIGARNSDVMAIFLIESGLLGFVGGVVGVVIGLGISYLVEFFGGLWLGTPYLKAWWSWGLIIGALAFSFLTGAGAGLAPAWRASRQKPVESLRYE